MLVAAFLGGKYSFGRFFDETAANTWLELRLWFTLAALAGIALQQVLFRARQPFHASAQLKWLLTGTIIFSIALLVHVLLFATPETKPSYATDAIYLAIHAALIAWVFRTRGDIMVAIYVTEAIATVFFILVLFGFHNAGAVGWAPFGTPITFYRLEFFACCGALYAMAVSDRPSIWLLHSGIASIALFSTLSSLARAAWFSSALVFVYVILVFLVIGRPKVPILIGALYLVVTMSFFVLSSGKVEQRMLERFQEFGPRHTQPVNLNASAQTAAPSSNTREKTAVRSTITTEMPAPGADQLPRQSPTQKTDLNLNDADEFVRTNRIILNDNTYRIQLFLHAWNLFQHHKVFGAGFGHYEVKGPNYAGDGLVTYRYPHNVFLEALSATGLAGTVVFSFVVGIGLVVLHQAMRLDANWAFLSAYPLSILLSAFSGGDIYDFRGFFFVTIMIGGVAWRYKT